MDKLVLAPIKGYTDPVWRSCYFKHFNGLDKVVTPFLLLSEHNRAKKGYFPQFLPELGSEIEVVPQFLAKHAETILHASTIMSDLGVTEFNLNMGCPAPAIVKKGRGSGLLSDLDSVKRLLDGVLPDIKGDFTVKIRSGVEDSSLIEPIINLLNNYPIKEVIVHPRFARQLYSGKPDMDAFSWVYNNSKNPVSYNGDIYSLGDFTRLKDAYPNVSSWMLGRGVLRDPLLPSIIKSGKEVDSRYRKDAVLAFIYDLDSIFKRNYDRGKIATNRVKANLIYIAAYYNDSVDFINLIKRSTTLDQMLKIIDLN